MSHAVQHYRRLLVAGSGLLFASQLFVAAMPLPVMAQEESAISRGFTAEKQDISVGSLVSLKKDPNNQVVSASTDNTDALVGVISKDSLLEIQGSSPEVQVVTSGITETLISDLNGDVKVGDKIAASPVRGVGMKLTGNGYSVGIAQKDLPKTEGATRSITAKDGSQKTIRVASIPVLVDVNYYATNDKDGTTSGPLLERLATAVAGKQTSTIRIAIAFTLVLMGFAIMVIVLRTSVATSMTSIGRNPLAESIIRKNFSFVVAIAFGIMVVALASAYMALIL